MFEQTKKIRAVAAMLLCAVLALLAGCQGPGASQASQASQTSQDPGSSLAGESTSEDLPAVKLPERVGAYNKESDLPEGCNILEVYGFGFDNRTLAGYFICRAMDTSGEQPVYLGDETYIFPFTDLPSVYMYDRQLAGYDGLSVFQDGGGLADYYEREVQATGGTFWPVRMSFTFESGDKVSGLQEADFTPSDIDITTGEPRD